MRGRSEIPMPEVAAEFDAHLLIVLGRAMCGFDLGHDLSRIKARVLFVLSRTDRVFPPSLAPGSITALREAGVRAEYFEIDSDLGHAAADRPERPQVGPPARGVSRRTYRSPMPSAPDSAVIAARETVILGSAAALDACMIFR